MGLSGGLEWARYGPCSPSKLPRRLAAARSAPRDLPFARRDAIGEPAEEYPVAVPPFTTRLAAGWRRGLEHRPLALVPLVTALMATEKVQRVATFRGGHFGLKLGLPVSLVDIWQLVNVACKDISDSRLGTIFCTCQNRQTAAMS